MLTEMARMSVEDGMVMQVHPGCWRNHNELIYRRFGRNIGGDMPMQVASGPAQPLLDRFGNNARLHPDPVQPWTKPPIRATGAAGRPLSLPETGPRLVVSTIRRKA